MNNAILPFLATMALGAIAGITGTHFHQVDKMVATGLVTTPAIINTPELEPPANDFLAGIPSTQLSISTEKAPSIPPEISNMTGETPREDALLELVAKQTQMLSDMHAQQSNLRKQLSETNREMTELTFRVDSHSSSFRPLRVNSARPRTLVTSPVNTPDADSNNAGVLPAKR